MGYQENRHRVVAAAYDRCLTQFLDRYVPGRPTAVFLPGARASQLRRTHAAYGREELSSDDRGRVLWCDPALLFDRDLEQLALRRIDGAYEDAGRHAVLPDGELRHLFKPYDELERALFNAQYNFVAFGFDWRRPLPECTEHFGEFLKALGGRVRSAFDEDPLPHLRIVAHGQGGLLLHLWLLETFGAGSTPSDADRWFYRAVCVGTPFYGTTNHLQRLWRGEPAFNAGIGENRARRVFASMPGPYALLPLDVETWETKRNRIGAPEYPVLDKKGAPADPLGPDQRDQYPAWVDSDVLREAAHLRRTTRAELAPAILDRVFNVRSKANRQTWWRISWLDGEAPRGVEKGPGDGAVPYWSGALAELPPAQIVDLTEAQSHVGLMEHTETIQALLGILGDPSRGAALASARAGGLAPCPSDHLSSFLTAVGSGRVVRGDRRSSDPRAWRRILEDVGHCGG